MTVIAFSTAPKRDIHIAAAPFTSPVVRDEFYKCLGERLAAARNCLSLSLSEAAGVIRKNPKTLKRWEAGARPRSSYGVCLFCWEYNISLDWLFTGQGRMFRGDRNRRLKVVS